MMFSFQDGRIGIGTLEMICFRFLCLCRDLHRGEEEKK